MKRSFNPWLLVMLIILGIFVFNQLNAGSSSQDVPYSTFIDLVQEGRVASVVIEEGNSIRGELTTERQVDIGGEPQTIQSFKTTPVDDSNLIPLLRENNVRIEGRNPSPWLGIAFSILPIIILIGFFWFIFMRAQGGSSQVMQFGQSKAKTYGRENKVKTGFDDVAGHEEAKQELKEVVDFLKSPQKYIRIGAEIPKGMLLVGPPGTGKTLLARAVAGEAGVPFLTGAPRNCTKTFVGVGASRVRNLFEEARESGSAIIFIDELDLYRAAARCGYRRRSRRTQTLNQIPPRMDGFEKDTDRCCDQPARRSWRLRPGPLRPSGHGGLPTDAKRNRFCASTSVTSRSPDDVDLERLAGSTSVRRRPQPR
ncbi:MAG: ATP-dependent metallopeptidase FtsH/Yme1/Tma family protein [Trueperaceae bacterium]|nr:ATP-dependent metallopeptidase FtsH/Yme1/Tma family protein [Trueperaceae bacterium]